MAFTQNSITFLTCNWYLSLATIEEIKMGKKDEYDPVVVGILTGMIEEVEIQFG